MQKHGTCSDENSTQLINLFGEEVIIGEYLSGRNTNQIKLK